MRKLNRSKPFGRIAGNYEVYPEAMYEQDGFFFSANGDCLNETATEEHGQEGHVQEEHGHGFGDEQEQLNELEHDGHNEATVQEEEADDESEQDGLLTDELSEEASSEEVEETEDTGPKMMLTDDELQELADDGMTELRQYAAQFGVNGTSKNGIIAELKSLRK
jgi:hypothetical protein